jgi:RNA polymerase sigma factor (sigma-70 family)
MRPCDDDGRAESGPTGGCVAAGKAEAEVHRRLVAGDETALAEVLDGFGGLVYGLALRVTRSPEAAEDIVQEVFALLWERPLAYDPDRGSLRGWLGTLAHHKAVDYVRREQNGHRVVHKYVPMTTIPPVDEAVVADDVAIRVQHAVSALPGAQREVIELAYYRGWTYRQVAAALGLPEGTVKSRIRLALRRLAAALREEELGS